MKAILTLSDKAVSPRNPRYEQLLQDELDKMKCNHCFDLKITLSGKLTKCPHCK